MADGVSIVVHATSCDNLFQKLCKLSKTHNVKNYPKNLSINIEREYDRFSLWARNIAALQDARYPSSLGYRIRHDSRAQTLVENALKYLEESLQMAIPIVSGEEPNEAWDTTDPMTDHQSMSDVENSSDQQQSDVPMQSELDELFTAIQGGVTHLFRLSMIIRKKPETDEYAKAASKFPMDPTSDIVHVKDKHSVIPVEHSWLSERLGTAITNRRQYLIFRREHQQKLSETHHLKTGKDGGTSWSGTRASTHHDTQGLGFNKPTQLSMSTARNFAQTEYADSSKGNDGSSNMLRTPLLPKNNNGLRYQYGDHFECPFCWRPQEVKNKTEWKKHVFSDLRPYVCTFESCNSSIFESQNVWFKHELDSHRRQWGCILCDDREMKSRRELESHLSEVHSNPQVKESHTEIIKKCLYPRISALDCPLCNEYGERLQKVNDLGKCDVSLKQFQQHLGRHMEQLALSALPTSGHDSDESEDDTDNTEDEIATMSSLKVGEKGTLKNAVRLMKRGNVHESIGELDQAESFYERAFQIFSKVVGSEHLSTIESMEHLGNVYMRKEMWTKAEEMFKSALSIKERLLGSHEPSTLSTAHHLGKVYMGMNRLDMAEKILHWAAQFSAIEATIDLGAVYMERGKWNEAEECFLLSAKRYEIDLGAEHPDTLDALNKLRLIRTKISPESRQAYLGTKIQHDQALRQLRQERVPLEQQPLRQPRQERVSLEQQRGAEQQQIEQQRTAEQPQLDSMSDSVLSLNPSGPLENIVQATPGHLENRSYPIKCICDSSDYDGNIVFCETCKTWQHTGCFYPGNVDNTSRGGSHHQCADCKPRPLNRRNARERPILQHLKYLKSPRQKRLFLESVDAATLIHFPDGDRIQEPERVGASQLSAYDDSTEESESEAEEMDLKTPNLTALPRRAHDHITLPSITGQLGDPLRLANTTNIIENIGTRYPSFSDSRPRPSLSMSSSTAGLPTMSSAFEFRHNQSSSFSSTRFSSQVKTSYSSSSAGYGGNIEAPNTADMNITKESATSKTRAESKAKKKAA